MKKKIIKANQIIVGMVQSNGNSHMFKKKWNTVWNWKHQMLVLNVGKSTAKVTHTHHVEVEKKRQYIWHLVEIVMRFLTKNNKRHRNTHTALTCDKQRFNTLIKSLFFWPTNFSDLLADAYDVWQ